MTTHDLSLVPPRGTAAASRPMAAAPLSAFDAAAQPGRLGARRTAEEPRALARAGAAGPPAVRQTVRSVVLEVQPASAEVLRGLVLALRDAEEATSPRYERLTRLLPSAHFVSMTIFKDAHYDPILVLEVNFDGAAGPFWAQLEAAIGPELRAMLRCCEPPRDGTGPMFEAITAPGSRRPIAPYLEAQAVRPAVHHVGNRGLARATIVRQAELYFAAQDELGDGTRFRDHDAQGVHRQLRAALLPRFPWLDQPEPARIARAERLADGLRLAAFAALVLFGLSVPGLVLALLVPAWAAVALSLAAALAFAARLDWLRELRAGRSSGRPGVRTAAAAVAALAAYVAALSAAAGAPLALLTGQPFAAAFWTCAAFFALGLVGVPATALAVLLWLRRLECRDPSQDAPPVDEDAMRAMARREDRVVQNHMGSIVLVKPGVLRAVLVRAGLWGLGLVLRVAATDGYLGSMRTIHFAHWALVSNGSRLMFFSNFDGSWESYLDDFIEKAHGGLTLAWGGGVGFPPARYLVLDGASQGRKFKAWARHSMAESLFWFSAYEHLTVDDIERHASVAEGLRRPTLNPEEAATWTRHL